MTTPTKRYTYGYHIKQISLSPVRINLEILIGDLAYEVLGMAIVEICQSDTMRSESVVFTTEELRYVIADANHEPDVTYREHPDFKGVRLTVR